MMRKQVRRFYHAAFQQEWRDSLANYARKICLRPPQRNSRSNWYDVKSQYLERLTEPICQIVQIGSNILSQWCYIEHTIRLEAGNAHPIGSRE